MPGYFYLNDRPEFGDGRHLEKLLNFFCPETPVDRELMRAAFITPAWGGPPGKRPMFSVVALSGRGMGKSRFTEAVGDVYAGIVNVTPEEEPQKIKARILGPDSLAFRVIRIDNLKRRKFSSGPIESLVTSSAISGWRAYLGNSNVPNYWTWFLTANGASFSKDFAQRMVEIRLSKPTYSGRWEIDLDAFLQSHREQILGDIISRLRSTPKPIDIPGRWALWESEVLARCEMPNECLAMVRQRREASDADAEEAGTIEDFFAARLASLGYDADKVDVFLPAQLTTRWYCDALGEKHSVTAVSRTLIQAREEGQISQIVRCRLPGSGLRGFRWIANHCDANSETYYDIEQRIAKKSTDIERDKEEVREQARIIAKTSVKEQF